MNPGNEAVRFERLRAQDGQPMVPPPNLAALSRGGGLDPAQVGQAQSVRDAAMAEMAQVPSYPAEERIFWTTFMLCNHFSVQQQREQTTALLHQTLPVLQQARHQQIFMGMMARNLAALGRPDEAHQYVSRLDAYSEDLQVDTNYRFSTAFVALLRNDAQTVLTVLGYNIDDIPISDAYDSVCAVYRAHAHEVMGNLDVAKQQLQKIAPTPAHLGNIEEMIRVTPQIPLVARTFPAVKMAVIEVHQNALTTNSGVNIRRIMMTAFLMVPIGLALSFGSSMLPASITAIAVPVIVVGMTVAMLAVTFGGLLKGAAKKKKVLASGLDGVAKLMEVTQTGTRVNDQPMLRLRMMIEIPGKPAYAVLHNEIVPQIRLAQVQPGIQLRVKVDPGDPRNMAIAWA